MSASTSFLPLSNFRRVGLSAGLALAGVAMGLACLAPLYVNWHAGDSDGFANRVGMSLPFIWQVLGLGGLVARWSYALLALDRERGSDRSLHRARPWRWILAGAMTGLWIASLALAIPYLGGYPSLPTLTLLNLVTDPWTRVGMTLQLALSAAFWAGIALIVRWRSQQRLGG